MNTPVDYFSASVPEADSKFREACRSAGVELRFHPHPKCGPDNEALNLGVCRVGPADAKHSLLIVSGTHGVEGFGGAGVQTGWLHSGGTEALPADTSVIMLHLLNPWGAAWSRRVNEDNVDIFRNLIYCDHPCEADPLYDLVDDTLNLAEWADRDPVAWGESAAALIDKYGEDRLQAAIRRGQHHRPNGMTYHGDKASWSKQRFDEITAEYLADARYVAVLDIHTGFGAYGHGLVMSYDPPGSEKHSRVSRWFDGKIYTPGSDAVIPLHREQPPFEWIEKMFQNVDVTAAILEFGTFDSKDKDDIFYADHHYHVFGDPLCAEARRWSREHRHFCYPEEDEWKKKVWARGREVIDKTLSGLKKWTRTKT